MNYILNIVSVIIFILIGIKLYKIQKKYFIYIMLFYVPQLWNIISCLYIESGQFVRELETYSFQTGATFRLVIFNLIFFIFLTIFLNNTTKFYDTVSFEDINITRFKKNLIVAVLFVLFLIFTALFINVFVSGIVIGNNKGITRFNFWTDYAKFKKLGKFQDYIHIYFILLSFIYILFKNNKLNNNKKYAYISIGLIGYVLIYLVISGNKFSLIFYPIFFALFPLYHYMRSTGKKIFSKRFVVIAILLVIMFGLLSIAEYKYIDRVDNPVAFMFDRIFALQGQVWWGIDRLYYTGMYNSNGHLATEINQILNPTDNNIGVGMKYLMMLISPNVASSYIQKGINFSGGYPAIILVSLGTWGTIIFQIGYAYIISILIKNLDFSINHSNIFEITFLCIIFFDAFYFFAMGDLGRLFNLFNSVIIVILFIERLMWLIDSKRNHPSI